MSATVPKPAPLAGPDPAADPADLLAVAVLSVPGGPAPRQRRRFVRMVRRAWGIDPKELL
jgi:hypothetical protein